MSKNILNRSNKGSVRRIGIGFAVVLIVMAVVSIAIGAFSSLGYGESFRIVFGSFYVLFLPGFIWSYVFFQKTKAFEEGENRFGNEGDKVAIDWIERVALSFALSIAIVPLVVFYLNLIGVKINVFNSFFSILGIITVGLAVAYWRNRKFNS
ncbi:MAG: DUF1616 domain-containing protein [Nanoarchaeota archaeon]|nr:DUF1616 domain-containing protein [Nanoarchaeota archaeon]